MAEIIDVYKEILETLKKSGDAVILNREEDLKAQVEMNKKTEKTKEEYQVKEMNSQHSLRRIPMPAFQYLREAQRH